MRKAYIYKITNPKGKIYIGSTFSIKNRWSCYRTLACATQVKIYNSLKKYTPEAHKFEIILECTSLDRYEKEIYFGKMFDVLGENGLNLTLPKNEIYKTISDETRKKLSTLRKGKKPSLETLQKRSFSLKGRITSEKTKKLMSSIFKGRKLTPERIEQMRIYNTGLVSKKRKKIIDTQTGIIYTHAKDCSEKLNISYSTLKNKLCGYYKNNTTLKYYDC